MTKQQSNNIMTIFQPLAEPICDILEMTIDNIVSELNNNPNLLKDIPIIKWFKAGYDFRNNIQTVAFLKKYAAFIGPLYDFSNDHSMFDQGILDELMGDKRKFDKLIEQTIITLDRYQTEFKAELLGILFCEIKKQTFTIKEYNSLLFSIELIHPIDGIEDLAYFYKYRIEYESAPKHTKSSIWEKYNNLDYSRLVTTGLLSLPTGGASMGNLGGAYINDLGVKFYENVVKKSKKGDYQF